MTRAACSELISNSGGLCTLLLHARRGSEALRTAEPEPRRCNGFAGSDVEVITSVESSKLVICSFCGRFRFGQTDWMVDNNSEYGGLGFAACDECRGHVERLGEARTSGMLLELVRVLREGCGVDPVEHVFAWERARRAKEARAGFVVV